MKIGKLEKKRHKWQFGIEFGRRWDIRHWWPQFRVWCLNLDLYPEPGSILTKRHCNSCNMDTYRGFYFDWSPKLPIVTVKTIRNPFKFGRRVYVIPVRFDF